MVEIITYREFKSKNELLGLLDLAFKWPLNPLEFEEIIKADIRLRDGPVGYGAVIDNRLAGFVGAMDLYTRNLDGAEEKVGGIWGVVTHPSYARRGISNALIKRCHEYFKEKNYRFSILMTGRTIIAYKFYQKLGYKEVLIFPSAYKLLNKPKKLIKKTTENYKLNWDKILEIYKIATKNRTGLLVRDKQYMDMLEKRKVFQPEKSIIKDEGYILLKEQNENIIILEIMALTNEAAINLIKLVEMNASKLVIDRLVLDKKMFNIYKSHGFMVLKDSFDVMMAKPLVNEKFSEVYGEKFSMTSSDLF